MLSTQRGRGSKTQARNHVHISVSARHHGRVGAVLEGAQHLKFPPRRFRHRFSEVRFYGISWPLPPLPFPPSSPSSSRRCLLAAFSGQCQKSPCLCEGVARRMWETPSHKHGVCPPLGFQRAFQLKVQRSGSNGWPAHHPAVEDPETKETSLQGSSGERGAANARKPEVHIFVAMFDRIHFIWAVSGGHVANTHAATRPSTEVCYRPRLARSVQTSPTTETLDIEVHAQSVVYFCPRGALE